jgi:hypothetical protein
MCASFLLPGARQNVRRQAVASRVKGLWRAAQWSLCAAFLLIAPAISQVITIDSNGVPHTGDSRSIDRRFAQVTPTQVPLSQTRLDDKTRLQLVRVLQAEQGFAMRPIPRGHKGLTLIANGKLEPAGEQYESMVIQQGLSAKPGDRLVITDVKIDQSKIVFKLNGGPDRKHRFLSHIEIGMGPTMGPVAQTDDTDPVGARLTLLFPHHIPELTGEQVKALLAPLISFDVKTPVQAFTDTLPTPLKDAILNHHIMVGMTTDMVMFAKGRPDRKMREMDGQMPFEVWIYGQPPHDVEFVRINGNRVIRVEIAKIGKPVEVFTADEVTAMMQTGGSPLGPGTLAKGHTVELGDVHRDPDTQAPAAPPTLLGAGEKAPDDSKSRVGVMRPVQFPKQKPDDYPDASAHRQPAAQPSDQTSATPSSENETTSPADDSSSTTPPSSPKSSRPQESDASQP